MLAALVAASIAFAPAPAESGFDWLYADANSASLFVELYPLDRRAAFLFGEVTRPPGPLRSVLLRSADGGKSWREVLAPLAGHAVTHVRFADRRHGWALVMLAVESPGPMRLFATSDGGLTWRDAGRVPSVGPDELCAPREMRLASPASGQLTIECEEVAIELRTDDAGKTWRRAPAPQDRRAPAGSAAAPRAPRAPSHGWSLQHEEGALVVRSRAGVERIELRVELVGREIRQPR